MLVLMMMLIAFWGQGIFAEGVPLSVSSVDDSVLLRANPSCSCPFAPC